MTTTSIKHFNGAAFFYNYENQQVFNMWLINGEIDMMQRHVSVGDFTLLKENEANGNYHMVTWLNASTIALYPNLNTPDPVLAETGAGQQPGGVLMAFDARTGSTLWRNDEDIFGTRLAVSELHPRSKKLSDGLTRSTPRRCRWNSSTCRGPTAGCSSSGRPRTTIRTTRPCRIRQTTSKPGWV